MSWIIKGTIWFCVLVAGGFLVVSSWLGNFGDPDTILMTGISLIVMALMYNPVYLVIRAIFKP